MDKGHALVKNQYDSMDRLYEHVFYMIESVCGDVEAAVNKEIYENISDLFANHVVESPSGERFPISVIWDQCGDGSSRPDLFHNTVDGIMEALHEHSYGMSVIELAGLLPPIVQALHEVLDGTKRILSFTNVLVTSMNIDTNDTTISISGSSGDTETISLQEQLSRFRSLEVLVSDQMAELANRINDGLGDG